MEGGVAAAVGGDAVIVGAAIVGAAIVGAAIVGAAIVGATLVGTTLVGAATLLGAATVVGAATLLGAVTVVGAIVEGGAVEGAAGGGVLECWAASTEVAWVVSEEDGSEELVSSRGCKHTLVITVAKQGVAYVSDNSACHTTRG